VGLLEALLETPRRPDGAPLTDSSSMKAAVVFGHPHPQHGGTMHTKMVFQAAKALSRIGCAVLRFNYRGVGSSAGTFGGGAGEMDDFRAALDYLHAAYPRTPLWAAGFSFGAWLALEAGAVDPRVSALVAIAPPVARQGYVFEHVRGSTKPKFFLQGDRDEVCPLKDLRVFYGALPEPKELVVIEGATHLFEGMTLEAAAALEDLLSDFSTGEP
jgi:alpha/beta superfamily hydrolase